MKYYTGIGSRETPLVICDLMTKVGIVLAKKGYILRSGKAQGADAAFQVGAQQVKGSQCEIYIPWRGFKGDVRLVDNWDILPKGMQEGGDAFEIMKTIHPYWSKCTASVVKLHCRNVYQVLGNDLQTPSKFVLYWAKVVRGEVSGGTATAVNLANLYDIPTINMYFDDWKDKVKEVLHD